MEQKAKEVTDKALKKFWEVVMAEFPEVESDHLDPVIAQEVDDVMHEAVLAWLYWNDDDYRGTLDPEEE